MLLAFSTNAYTLHSLTTAIDGIAQAGYDGVEILADKPHAYPGQLPDEEVASLRRQLDHLNLRVSNVNVNCTFGYWKDAPPEPYFEPSLISPNPKYRADRTRLIALALRFASQVGAKNISITSGRMLGGMPPDKAAAQFRESILPILDLADRLKIDVGIECEPGLFIEFASELRTWIDHLNHPRLGANLDIGHSQVLGESIPETVQLLAGKIWNLHVEDIPARKHYHLIPGEGTLNWPALRDALRTTNYDRFATVELYTHTANPQEAAEKSIAFLRNLFNDHP